MWSLLPVTLALIHTVTSRTEPLDFFKSDRHNEILIPSDSVRQRNDLKDFKLFPKQLQKINFDDTNDSSNWNNLATRYSSQVLNSEKNLPFGDIDTPVFDQLDEIIPEDYEEVELNRMSSYLLSILQQPSWNRPLIIMEEPEASDDFPDDQDIRVMGKRSRYYRRYPWKRQNGRSRNTYDYDSPHLCTPSREDVYQLLVALHDVRQGNKSRTVHFCNRRRPVNTVFTNIRFLGRRK